MDLLTVSLEKFLNAEDVEISRYIELALRPPITLLDYSRIFHGTGLPPQPKAEVIDPNVIGDVHLFIAADLLASLGSFEELDELRDRAESILSHFNEKITLYPEDSPKTNVALALPEEEHLEVVKGKWSEWVWKPTTYNNEEAPSFEGWVNDLVTLADSLKGEGIKVHFIAGNSGKILKEMGYNVIKVQIEKILPKLGYPRDPSIAWSSKPILMNMALNLRKGEENVASQFFHKLGLDPIFRPRWWFDGKRLIRAKAEGGNFILIKNRDRYALFTGIGVRGSNQAAIELIGEYLKNLGIEVDLYGVPLSGYIRNWRSGAVHLDVVMMHAGPAVLLNPRKMGFYSLLKYAKGNIKIVETGEVFKELDLEVDEAFGKGSDITLVNGFNLGKGKIIVDSFNVEANQYLEKEWGLDLIKVDIPQIEAGGGGARCATREYYP